MPARALVAFAAVILAGGLGLSKGTFDPWALGAVGLACVASLGALFARVGDRRPDWPLPTIILAAGVAGSLAWDLLELSAIYVEPERAVLYRPLVLLMMAAVGSLAWRRAPARFARARLVAILLVAAALGALVIHASPKPYIDVWVMRTQAARALLDGHNPYAVGYPNLYGADSHLVSSTLLSADGRYIFVYPYLPLTILVDLIGSLAGDVRSTSVLAMLGSAILVVRLGRGSLTSVLAGALILVQPVSLFVVEQSWTEPIVLLALLGTALALERQRSAPADGGSVAWVPAAVVAALAASTKQYAWLLLTPFLILVAPRWRWRSLALAVALAMAGAIPWLVWDLDSFLRGVLATSGLLVNFRPDALSLPAALMAMGGPRLPAWPGFVLAITIFAMTARSTVDPGRALLAAGAAWLGLVAFSMQAFCNYYWLAVGLLCGAVAAWSATPASAVPPVEA